jgi:hypothetical protein
MFYVILLDVCNMLKSCVDSWELFFKELAKDNVTLLKI